MCLVEWIVMRCERVAAATQITQFMNVEGMLCIGSQSSDLSLDVGADEISLRESHISRNVVHVQVGLNPTNSILG